MNQRYLFLWRTISASSSFVNRVEATELDFSFRRVGNLVVWAGSEGPERNRWALIGRGFLLREYTNMLKYSCGWVVREMSSLSSIREEERKHSSLKWMSLFNLRDWEQLLSWNWGRDHILLEWIRERPADGHSLAELFTETQRRHSNVMDRSELLTMNTALQKEKRVWRKTPSRFRSFHSTCTFLLHFRETLAILRRSDRIVGGVSGTRKLEVVNVLVSIWERRDGWEERVTVGYPRDEQA